MGHKTKPEVIELERKADKAGEGRELRGIGGR